MEQTSWKGHSFTLMVFAGTVVLCSIFFILGMLVGRSQGRKIATVEASDVASKPEIKPSPDVPPDLTFYDSVESKQPAPAPEPPLATAPSTINYQISALTKSSDAEKLLSELKKKGFRAFILAPSAGDKNPLYRVQVGPFSEEQEAELVRRQLESAKYKPIKK